MKKVLIVDDNVINIDVLKEVLKSEYKITAAISGMMALKIAEKTHPDIILLDIIMPGMDGFEVCRRLKANDITKNIPVVFVTGNEQDAENDPVEELGVVGYLTKPVVPDLVKETIQKILG